MGARHSILLQYSLLNSLMFDNYVSTDMKKTHGWSLIQNVTRRPISRISKLAFKTDLNRGAPQHRKFSLDSIIIYALHGTVLLAKKNNQKINMSFVFLVGQNHI